MLLSSQPCTASARQSAFAGPSTRAGSPWYAEPRACIVPAVHNERLTWSDSGINLSAMLQRSETCVTGFVIGLLSWFAVDDARTARRIPPVRADARRRVELPAERRRDAQFVPHNANVLDGLRGYVTANGRRRHLVTGPGARGREYMLARRPYRSHRPGAVVDPKMLRLTFPSHWRHDVLRGIDHFRAAAAPWDDRLPMRSTS
jgi:hypothetical protein